MSDLLEIFERAGSAIDADFSAAVDDLRSNFSGDSAELVLLTESIKEYVKETYGVDVVVDVQAADYDLIFGSVENYYIDIYSVSVAEEEKKRVYNADGVELGSDLVNEIDEACRVYVEKYCL